MHHGTPRRVSPEFLSHRCRSVAIRRPRAPARQAQSDSVMTLVAGCVATPLAHCTLRTARLQSTRSRSVPSCFPGNAPPASDRKRQPSEQLDGSPSPGHGSSLGCFRGALGRPFAIVAHDDSNFRRTNAINGIQELDNADGRSFSGFGFESSSWLEKPGGRVSSDDAGHACFKATPLSTDPGPARIAAHDAHIGQTVHK